MARKRSYRVIRMSAQSVAAKSTIEAYRAKFAGNVQIAHSSWQDATGLWQHWLRSVGSRRSTGVSWFIETRMDADELTLTLDLEEAFPPDPDVFDDPYGLEGAFDE